MRPDPHAATAWDVIDATRLLHRRLEIRLDDALDGCAISYAQLEILDLLTRDKNAHAAAIARRLRVSRQIASRLLGKLDRAGLVDLLPPDGGVRVPLVTAEGRRRIELARRATATIREQIDSIPPERRTQLLASIEAIEDLLRSPPTRPWWLG